MVRESDWISNTVWLVLLGIAFLVGLALVGQAFASNLTVLHDITLRVNADYSADPRAAQAAQVPIVDSAVISDTKRDLIIEQTLVPVLGSESIITVTVTPTASRTPTPTPMPMLVRTRTPTARPRLESRSHTPGPAGESKEIW